MSKAIKIILGGVVGLVFGVLLFELITGWVGSNPNEDELYIDFVLVGIPIIGGLGAGLFSAFELDEDDSFVEWLLSVLIIVGVSIIAAIVAVIIFFIMMLIYFIANMSFADWALVAILIGLMGGVVIFIIGIFNG